jgi:hypothetical protein
MEAAGSSETLVTTFETTRCHDPEVNKVSYSPLHRHASVGSASMHARVHNSWL